MALSKADLDKIRDNDKFAVAGFIRNVQTLFDSEGAFYIIPDLVSLLILSFYHTFDRFDKDLCGTRIRTSDDGLVVDNDHINDTRHFQYSTIYGIMVIDSMINGKYIWKFRNLGPQTYTLNIGIDNADANCLESGTYKNKKKASYIYHSGGGEMYVWDKNFSALNKNRNKIRFNEKNSILTMELEFVENRKGGILRFKVDQQEFNGYDDVLREEGLKYRMCVSADGPTDIKLELLP